VIDGAAAHARGSRDVGHVGPGRGQPPDRLVLRADPLVALAAGLVQALLARFGTPASALIRPFQRRRWDVPRRHRGVRRIARNLGCRFA